jgi:transcriptional regulator with XRE-family HTH domain
MSEIIQLQTPASAQRMLADRVRAARVGLELKQSTLATRAGVALASLRRFEQSGEVSLKHLMRICHALGRIDEFDAILRPPAAATMAELESRAETPARKRGSR